MTDSDGAAIGFTLIALVALYLMYRLICDAFWWLFHTPMGHLILLIAFAAVLFAKRERLLLLFYSLTPHPATRAVNRAIYRGEPIDGELYADVAEPCFENRFKDAARAAQAEALARRLREHEAALRAREARQAERVRRKVTRENGTIRAHIELLGAGIDHETAVVQLDEYRGRD